MKLNNYVYYIQKGMFMDKFYFEIPSLKRKNEIIDFLDEFIEFKSNINGSGGLDRIYKGYTFEEALERCLRMSDEDYAKSQNKCPGKTFLLIRERDNKIVATINLRWNLNEIMLKFGGHIGYGVRPTERRKGYNKLNLYMALKKAQELGLKKVMLDCSIDNIASNKTIQALGGIFERCELDPYDNTKTNVYWINVDESIEKYKDIYEQYISIKK